MTGTGPADLILSNLHLASRQTYWLIGPNALWAMIIADVWAAWPFVYMMTDAALRRLIQSQSGTSRGTDGSDRRARSTGCCERTSA